MWLAVGQFAVRAGSWLASGIGTTYLWDYFTGNSTSNSSTPDVKMSGTVKDLGTSFSMSWLLPLVVIFLILRRK